MQAHVAKPKAIPDHGVHPEQLTPLGKPHEQRSEDKPLIFLLSVALVALLVLTPIVAATSGSPILNVLLGFSVLLIIIILDLIVVKQHFKTVTLWVILLLVCLLGFAALSFINTYLAFPMNVGSIMLITLFVGALLTLACMLLEERMPQQKVKHTIEFKPEKIQEYVQSIEDKAKAINFVIGRVYRASNGGSAKMRARLQVPSEWYNEFTALHDTQEQLEKAASLIRKIRDRLAIQAMPERDVFSHEELANLRNIARNKDGHDEIIKVLAANDSDPVENCYASAVEFCDRILEELETNQQ